MKMSHAIPALSLLALSCCPLQAQANLLSTFASGDEGWQAIDPTGDYTSSWQSTGGNPGGYLLGIETSPRGGDGYFTAPASWLGNWSAYAGGTIGYDLKVISGTATFWDPDVIIASGATSVSWSSPVSFNPVGKGWVHFEVPLDSANFGSDLASVLGNVTSLKIRGEWINGTEQEGFDNVSVTAVPEPETWAMLLAGLGLLGFAARREKQKTLLIDPYVTG
jgi:hypothetical protein